MNEHLQKAAQHTEAEIAVLRSSLGDVERQIGHIVSAVSKGFTQPAFVQKLSELDAAGVAIDGAHIEQFAAAADKKELFRLGSDAV